MNDRWIFFARQERSQAQATEDGDGTRLSVDVAPVYSATRTVRSPEVSLGDLKPTELITDALRRCLPVHAVCAGGRTEVWQGMLFPEEQTAVAHDSRLRKATFRAGRSCARAALRKLGETATVITRARDGRPCWPDGVVGAITHTNVYCAATVARRADCEAIGLDIEMNVPLEPNVCDLVCRRDERMLLSWDLASFDGPIATSKLIFVIKEAVFKAYYPVTRQFLDFQDVRLSIDRASQIFEAEIQNPQRPSLAGYRKLKGRWTHVSDHLLAAIALPRGTARLCNVTPV